MVEVCPYEVLGLAPDTAFLEVRAAYLRLAKRHHPDKLPHLTSEERARHEEVFKRISQAYDTIEKQEVKHEATDTCASSRDWRSIWARAEALFSRPEVRATLEHVMNVATKTMKRNNDTGEVEVHSIHVPVTLEEVHLNKKKRLQLFLKGVSKPIIVRIECGAYPGLNIKQTIDFQDHLVCIHMDMLPHTSFKFDEKTWDLHFTYPISWHTYLNGMELCEVPSLDPTSESHKFAIPPFAQIASHEVRIFGEGLAKRGDIVVHLSWCPPSKESIESLTDEERQSFNQLLNALSAHHSSCGARALQPKSI